MDSIDRFRHWSYKSPVNVKWLGVCCCQIGFNLIFIHHSVVSVLYAIAAVSSLTVKTCIVSFAINQKLITHTHTHTPLYLAAFSHHLYVPHSSQNKPHMSTPRLVSPAAVYFSHPLVSSATPHSPCSSIIFLFNVTRPFSWNNET